MGGPPASDRRSEGPATHRSQAAESGTPPPTRAHRRQQPGAKDPRSPPGARRPLPSVQGARRGLAEAGNMAGRPAAPASPPPDRDRAAPNVVARISQWADDHLRLVRVPPSRLPGSGGRWASRREPGGPRARPAAGERRGPRRPGGVCAGGGGAARGAGRRPARPEDCRP